MQSGTYDQVDLMCSSFNNSVISSSTGLYCFNSPRQTLNHCANHARIVVCWYAFVFEGLMLLLGFLFSFKLCRTD